MERLPSGYPAPLKQQLKYIIKHIVHEGPSEEDSESPLPHC